MSNFVLPEKWAVKRNASNYKVINAWANEQGMGEYVSDNGFVHSEGVEDSSAPLWDNRICEGFMIITFEQFEKYVVNPNKEIVGYVLKESAKYYMGAIAQLVGPSINGYGWNINLEKYGWMFTKGCIYAECLRQAGVLDIWFDAVYGEPVREETLNGSANSCKVYMKKGKIEADGKKGL